MSIRHKVPKKCVGCSFRAKQPETALGHTHCSVYRPCTGNKYWEPDACSVCYAQEMILKNMNGVDRYNHLGVIKNMLDEVVKKVKLSDATRNWEYEPIYDYKFRKFMHFERLLNSPADSPANSPKKDDDGADVDVIVLDSEQEQELYDDTDYQANDDNLPYQNGDETSVHSNYIIENVCSALQ